MEELRCLVFVTAGERIICINAETGKDNKFAGKMQGPYTKLLALTMKDSMLAIPHLSRQFHILKLSGEVSLPPRQFRSSIPLLL